MKDRYCAFLTATRRCGMDACIDQWCPYHAARVQRSLRPDQEPQFFHTWCVTKERWQLCLDNPALLWKILTGLASVREAPKGAFRCPEEEAQRNYWPAPKAIEDLI